MQENRGKNRVQYAWASGVKAQCRIIPFQLRGAVEKMVWDSPILGLERDKPIQKISLKIGNYAGKHQKNLNVCAFFHDSSDRRCRSSIVDHRAGNRFRRRWLPEMKSGDTSIFISTSWTRIYPPNSLISSLNPIMRLNLQEPLEIQIYNTPPRTRFEAPYDKGL